VVRARRRSWDVQHIDVPAILNGFVPHKSGRK
jgi:hypothetical protein